MPDNFINGTVTDNLGVASGSIKLYYNQGSARFYWNGSEFTTTNVSIPMTLTGSDPTNVAWTLSLPPASLDPGSYTVLASVKDATGNLAPNVTRTFTIRAEPVSAARKKKTSSAKTF